MRRNKTDRPSEVLINGYVGKRYNKVTVLSFSERRNRRNYFIVQCDCGIKKSINISDLTSGNTKSCGCYMRGSSRYL